MRTFVIGDIHGMFDMYQKLFKQLEEKFHMDLNNDRLIFLGDYIDRGPDAYKVIKHIRGLQEKYKEIIPLMGNHEKMLLGATSDSFMQPSNYRLWMSNGGETTVRSFEENIDIPESVVDWILSLPLYFEDDNFIYVHAGINPDKKMEEQDKETLLWTRQDFLSKTKKYYKPVVFGHTPTEYYKFYYDTEIDDKAPYVTSAGNIGIDTGAVYGGALTAMIIDNNTYSFFQVV